MNTPIYYTTNTQPQYPNSLLDPHIKNSFTVELACTIAFLSIIVLIVSYKNRLRIIF